MPPDLVFLFKLESLAHLQFLSDFDFNYNEQGVFFECDQHLKRFSVFLYGDETQVEAEVADLDAVFYR